MLTIRRNRGQDDGVAMKERWERFLAASQAQKSRLKTAPTVVEFFMALGVDTTDMFVGQFP